METFDMDKWLDDYGYLKFNQEHLGIKIELKVSDRKVKIKTDASPSLKPQLTELITDVIKGANTYAVISLPSHDIEEKDREAFYNEWTEYYLNHMEAFLCTLFNKNAEAFLSLLSKAHHMHELAYYLKHTWPEIDDKSSICWKSNNGYEFKENSYWSKNTKYGTMIRSDSNIEWNNLL